MLQRPHLIVASAIVTVTAVTVAVFVVGSGLASGPPAGDDASEEVAATTGLRQVPVADRLAPVRMRGETLDRSPLDVADWRGRVVVVNVWASWCGPCRAEAEDLMQVYDDTRDEDVEFVGIDVKDQLEAANAFTREFAIAYPSFFDADSRLLLSLSGTVPVTAIPSTVLLDRQGRVGASIVGAVDAELLAEQVGDLLAEGASRSVFQAAAQPGITAAGRRPGPWWTRPRTR